MFVSCDICKYDSGDRDSCDELEKKVNADGGYFEQTPNGCIIRCPNGHDGDELHMD
jgi:hypothetical protein